MLINIVKWWFIGSSCLYIANATYSYHLYYWTMDVILTQLVFTVCVCVHSSLQRARV